MGCFWCTSSCAMGVLISGCIQMGSSAGIGDEPFLQASHLDWSTCTKTACMKCVLHRDIKSGNVLLDADFNPYLGDFGLVRLVDHGHKEKTTMVAGTHGYMAPEMQHTGKATCKRNRRLRVWRFNPEVVTGKAHLDAGRRRVGDVGGQRMESA